MLCESIVSYNNKRHVSYTKYLRKRDLSAKRGVTPRSGGHIQLLFLLASYAMPMKCCPWAKDESSFCKRSQRNAGNPPDFQLVKLETSKLIKQPNNYFPRHKAGAVLKRD